MGQDFNPRPREGGDERSQMFQTVINAFQSTPPRGGRRSPGLPSLFHSTISIHAPARGATQVRRPCSDCPSISIHAPARGATQGGRGEAAKRPISIHAPARGATASNPISQAEQYYFNPRPREGGDVVASEYRFAIGISIHAPARGATQRIQPGTAPLMISIHAPARGATAVEVNFSTYPEFQSTPPRGGRL